MVEDEEDTNSHHVTHVLSQFRIKTQQTHLALVQEGGSFYTTLRRKGATEYFRLLALAPIFVSITQDLEELSGMTEI